MKYDVIFHCEVINQDTLVYTQIDVILDMDGLGQAAVILCFSAGGGGVVGKAYWVLRGQEYWVTRRG